MYTVEWIEDKDTEVVVVYDDYNEAMNTYRELKDIDSVTNVVLSIRKR